MYFDFFEKRIVVINVFMFKKNNEKLFDENQLDTLLKLTNTMSIDTNLQRVTIVIQCEFIYDSKLMFQISKRVHRQENFEKM